MARVPKEVSLDRERRAWQLRQHFYTQERIADELGVTVQAVSLMLKRARKRFLDEFKEEIEAQKADQTVGLERAAEDAWDAWERSKLNAESEEVTEEETEVNAPNGGAIPAVVRKTKRTSKGQSGDARHLANFLSAVGDLRKLWGLDAPQKIEGEVSLKSYHVENSPEDL